MRIDIVDTGEGVDFRALGPGSKWWAHRDFGWWREKYYELRDEASRTKVGKPAPNTGFDEKYAADNGISRHRAVFGRGEVAGGYGEGRGDDY